MKTIRSRNNYDTNGYEIDLIKNLKLIKNKLQTERWIEEWNEEELLHKWYSLNMMDEIIEYKWKFWDLENLDEMIGQSLGTKIIETFEIREEMVENNDCYTATKVSRILLNLGGKIFQGITNLMIA